MSNTKAVPPAAFSHVCATACTAAAPTQVGIFDADVYGPSLPTMVSPELRILRMNPDTRAITPTEYEGVQLVSFGFAGQGSAIMRGAMVSGLIQQMLTTTEWGEAHWGGHTEAQAGMSVCVSLTAEVRRELVGSWHDWPAEQLLLCDTDSCCNNWACLWLLLLLLLPLHVLPVLQVLWTTSSLTSRPAQVTSSSRCARRSPSVPRWW